MLLLQVTDSKWYTTYLIALTLSVLEGRFPIARLFSLYNMMSVTKCVHLWQFGLVGLYFRIMAWTVECNVFHSHEFWKVIYRCRELVMTCASLHAESQMNTPDAAPRASVTLKGLFLPHDALQCKAWSCDRMSSVRLSVCDIGGSWPHRLKILETNCTNN